MRILVRRNLPNSYTSVVKSNCKTSLGGRRVVGGHSTDEKYERNGLMDHSSGILWWNCGIFDILILLCPLCVECFIYLYPVWS